MLWQDRQYINFLSFAAPGVTTHEPDVDNLVGSVSISPVWFIFGTLTDGWCIAT